MIKKEIKQEKKSKRREKILEKEIYMRIEKKGGHRYWFINGEVVGPNQFAEGVIPYNAKEI
ncbi:germination protein YpeB [Patescibacteria group bacterium]|nr:germination protein YpeB [Patescibacteria group bacterium]